MTAPSTVGKYDVLDVIGIGGMGTVYRAFDRMLQRVVALKIVRLEQDLTTVDVSARFRNEARAVAQLHHPSIVTIFDYDDRDPAGPYIAMEYVDGCALNQYVRRRPALHLADAMSAMQQVLDGVIYAHRRGVIHRDIKPSNLLVTRDGSIKITDFGIARIGPSSQTLTGAVMGTPQYMAPEQFRGEVVDHRCDIYATGAVLYTLLTGNPPFKGTPVEVMYQACNDPPRPLTYVDPGIPRSFEGVITRALAKSPADRYASATEFRDALTICWQGVSANAATPTLSDMGRKIVIDGTRPGVTSAPAASPGAVGPAVGPGPSPPSLPPVSGQPPASLASWSREHLAEIERQLMLIMGPMARILVRDAAATTASKQELYHLLASQLSTPEERRRFLQLGGHLPAAVAATNLDAAQSSASQSSMLSSIGRRPLTPEVTQRASQLLARYLGPIAMLVTRNAASSATDETHLYALLAERVTDRKERDRFISEVAKQRRADGR